MSWIIFKILINLKDSESDLRRTNVNPNDHIHRCVIDCHGNSLLHFGLNTKVSCEGVSGGEGVKLF